MILMDFFLQGGCRMYAKCVLYTQIKLGLFLKLRYIFDDVFLGGYQVSQQIIWGRIIAKFAHVLCCIFHSLTFFA